MMSPITHTILLYYKREMWKFRCLKCLKRWKFGGNITSNWHNKQLEQTSYADVEIKERLDAFRKKKDANVAKTAMARWLLSVVYHVLKERRPYIKAYIILAKDRGRLLFRLANPLKVDCAV